VVDAAPVGGGGGGPLRGAVGVAQCSGPSCCGVADGTHPAEPRVRSFEVIVGAPVLKDSARVGQRTK
jgi:hypothetical protein